MTIEIVFVITLAAFILSNNMKQVRHGNPGIGASKSSAYVPLK